jgi:hypothetical protein
LKVEGRHDPAELVDVVGAEQLGTAEDEDNVGLEPEDRVDLRRRVTAPARAG